MLPACGSGPVWRVEALGTGWIKGYQEGSRFLVLVVCVSFVSLLGRRRYITPRLSLAREITAIHTTVAPSLTALLRVL